MSDTITPEERAQWRAESRAEYDYFATDGRRLIKALAAMEAAEADLSRVKGAGIEALRRAEQAEAENTRLTAVAKFFSDQRNGCSECPLTDAKTCPDEGESCYTTLLRWAKCGEAARRAGPWLAKEKEMVKPIKCCAPGEYTCQVPMAISGRRQDIDLCIADVVAALNAANIITVASCCGHGTMDGAIALADGRVLSIKLERESYGAATKVLP